MPQSPVEDNNRMSLRIASDEKAVIMRAAALTQTNLTEFVVSTVLNAAREIIEKNEKVELSGQDSLQVLNLLEYPPAPNEKLLKAALSLPKQ